MADTEHFKHQIPIDNISDLTRELKFTVSSSLPEKPPESLIRPSQPNLEFVETTQLPSGRIKVDIRRYTVADIFVREEEEGIKKPSNTSCTQESPGLHTNTYLQRYRKAPVPATHDMLSLLPRPLDYYPPHVQEVIMGINSLPIPKYEKNAIFVLHGKRQLRDQHKEDPQYEPDAKGIADLLGFIREKGKYRFESGEERVQRCLDRLFKTPRLEKLLDKLTEPG